MTDSLTRLRDFAARIPDRKAQRLVAARPPRMMAA